MGIRVRRIIESEGALLREIRIAALKDSPFAFGASLEDEMGRPMEDYVSDATRLATSESTATFLALKDDKTVGQIGAFMDSGKAYVCAMWVSPSARRNKVGSRLFDSAAGWLADLGARRIFAWVADSNSSAVDFYESLGFTATHQVQPLPSNPSESETLYVYGQ